MDERIRRRAYEIWEREGRPQGREAEHWRMAAEELAEATPAETQDVPAARVRGPAKLDDSTTPAGASRPSSEAQTSTGTSASATPRPDPQRDPLGLAQPAAKAAPRKRGSAKPRVQPDPSSPPSSGNGLPDRSR